MSKRQSYNRQYSSGRGPGKRLSFVTPILFLAALSLVLAISVGLLLRQALKKAEVIQIVTIEKEALNTQRDSLLVQLDILESEYDIFLAQNQDFEQQVSIQKQELNRLRALVLQGVSREVLNECEKRIDELSFDLSEFQNEISLLNAEKQMLSGENQQMRTALQQMSDLNLELENKKQELSDQIERASALKITQVTAQPIRERRRGAQETHRARYTDNVKVCCVILENPLARAGSYDFYFRIIDPDQKILNTDGVSETMHQEVQIEISDMRTVSYNNIEMEQCFVFDYPDGFQKGVYHVEIFTEDNELWRGVFELR
jgi:hypothetical protein